MAKTETKAKLPVRPDFQEAYEKYFDTVYRIIYIYIKRQSDTAEVASDVFFKFLLQKKPVTGDKEQRAWFIRNAYGAAMEYFRAKLRVEPKITVMKTWNLPFEIDGELEALLTVPEKYRGAVYFSCCEGLSPEEISKAMGKPLFAVRSLIKKGEELYVKKLRIASKNEKAELDMEKAKESFGYIICKEERKEHLYHELLRSYNNRKQVTKARFRYAKRKVDAYIPYIAVAAIVICLFSWYAVSSGLLTGLKFVHSKDLMDQYDYNYSGEDSVKITAPTGEGYTEYELVGFNGSIYDLWSEMREMTVVPSSFDIEYCTYAEKGDRMVLTVAFDAELQNYLNKAEDDRVLVTICKSFSDFYYNADDIIIKSDEIDIVFEGKLVDTAELRTRELNILATESLDYSK